MAITNAQQYQQLVNKPANGKRPGYRGVGEYQSGRSAPGSKRTEESRGFDTGPNVGRDPKESAPVDKSSQLQTFNQSPQLQGPIQLNKREQLLKDFTERRPKSKFSFGLFDMLSGGKLGQAGMDFLASKNRPFFAKVIEGGRFQLPGELGEKYGKLDMFDLNKMTEEELEEAYDAYDKARLGGEIRAIGDKKPGFGKDQGDYSTGQLPLESILAAKPTDEEVIEETFTPNFRLMADGGRAGFFKGAVAGGENISPGTDVKGNIRKDNPFAGREPEGPTVKPNDRPSNDTGLLSLFSPTNLRNKLFEYAGLKSMDTSTEDDEDEKVLMENLARGITNMDQVIDRQKLIENRAKELGFNMGGRAGLAGGGMPYEGGIMDLESGRQMYFLGKLVKKATRAVKKIVKSPIGKAALLAAPFVMGGGLTGLKGKLLGVAGAAGTPGFGGKEGLLKSLGLIKDGYGEFGGLTGKGMFGLGSLFTLAPFLMDEEDTTNQSQMYKGADLPYPVDYYLSGKYGMNRRLVADGGMMRANYQEGGDAEPVAKKTMPLIDMDGQEKDYRETGGFVDMGRMERADDVPARLSKNEFVFTADAVRNAGEGDIDKGAEVMYNMMKNLEAGGEVSEESQGLEGARNMFQTSQRLEEVL